MSGPQILQVTPGQRDALIELAHDGATDQQIADRLGITAGSVRGQISRVLHAAGMTGRTELAVALIRGRVKLRVADHRRPA